MLADKMKQATDHIREMLRRLSRLDAALIELAQQFDEYKSINEQQHKLLRELFHGDMRPEGERMIREMQGRRNGKPMR